MAINVPKRGNVPAHVIPTDPSNPASMPPGNPGPRRKRHQRFVSRGGVVSAPAKPKPAVTKNRRD